MVIISLISPTFNIFNSNLFGMKMPVNLFLTGKIKDGFSVRKTDVL